MKLEIEYYNQKEFWDGYIDNEKEIIRANKTINLIPNDVKKILDIGCGNGIVSNMIRKEVVISMDIAFFPLKQVKNEVLCASIAAIPLKKRTFDLILITEVLEHLTDSIFSKAIFEIKRLDPHYILITVPFKENLEQEMCLCKTCGNIFHSYHHYRNFKELWYLDEFPEYDVVSVQYMSYRIFYCKTVSRLKHFFGIYSSYKNAMCPKCGGSSKNPGVFNYPFIILNLIEYRFKKIFKLCNPYHQIILLCRK